MHLMAHARPLISALALGLACLAPRGRRNW